MNTEELNKKIQQLKSSFTVEGVPLLKTDRFTEEDLIYIKSRFKGHSSHWHSFSCKKSFTDEQIAEQIKTLYEQPLFSEQKLKEIKEKLFSALPFKELEEEKQNYKFNLYSYLGWDKLTPMSEDFWACFGSAPYNIHDSNENLIEYAKKYGAVGMTEIFGERFNATYHYRYAANMHDFDARWKERNKLKITKETIFSSSYNSLDELEENVPVKKIAEEAKKFYMDKTKNLEERIKVFSSHGKSKGSIFHPVNPILQKAFEIHNESDWVERHQMIDCAEVMWSWIDNMKHGRCKLDWTNPCHPVLKSKARNYKPSEAAIQRLWQIYMEALFLEGIGSFEFDW